MKIEHYCVDCIWSKDSNLPGAPFCENTAGTEFALVQRRKKYHRLCWDRRAECGDCGPEAKLFEPKPKSKNWFTRWLQ